MALKDIGRGLGIDHNIINEMNKMIPVHQGKVASIEDALKQVPELQEYQTMYPELFELAMKVESLPRTNSIHACGMVIAPKSLYGSIPLIKGKNGEIVTQYEGPTLEKLGIIKFDFLGLKNLSVIDIARKLAKERHGVDIDPDALEPEDPKVFATIQQGFTDGLFQIESEGMKKLFRGINKVDFETLIAGVALYRPGPMEHIPDYQAKSNGLKEVSYPHADLERITKNTFGIAIYQEQIMQITGQFGGYSPGKQDGFRKAIGKKSQEVMDKVLPELNQDILDHNYSHEIAEYIINIIKPFVGYGFNRSHAACYAYICYQTAFFKTHYPIEFMCGLLTIFGENQDKCVQYIEESKRMGISVQQPDINFSERGFSIDGKSLRYGLASIKGMGEAVVDNILAARPFSSLEDLIERVPKRIMNKRVINVLCRSGALDGLGHEHKNRLAILQYLYMLRGDKDDISYEVSKYDKQAMLKDEKELIGVYVSSHPLEGMCEKLNLDYIADNEVFDNAGIIRSFKEIRTKSSKLMAMVNLETLSGEIKLVVFPDVYEKLDVPLQDGLIVKFSAYFKFNFQYNERSCLAKKFTIPKRINSQILKK